MMVDFASKRSGKASTRTGDRAGLHLAFSTDHDDDLRRAFGALPLAFGAGEGSELRHPLGITIVGGLIVSQVLTLYTTPIVFIY